MAAPPGGDGDLVNRVQGADTSIIRLINYGTGRDDLAVLPSANPNEPAQRTPIADNPALGWARVFFLSSTIAAFAAVRLTAGVLLALAPLFAGLLLFDMARGLFVGWLRALVFALLASVVTTIVLGVQLALLEPWLAQVIQLRQSNALAAAAPIELLVICLAFALALFGSLGILLRLAFTVHVPAGRSEMKEAPAPAPTADTSYTVRFAYPDGRSENATDATTAQVGRYRLSGARALRPSAISDDGVRTYVEWRAQQTLPAVFAIDERGDEVLLDGHMRDGRYVVDAVHPTLLFRLERQTARANRIRPRSAR